MFPFFTRTTLQSCVSLLKISLFFMDQPEGLLLGRSGLTFAFPPNVPSFSYFDFSSFGLAMGTDVAGLGWFEVIPFFVTALLRFFGPSLGPHLCPFCFLHCFSSRACFLTFFYPPLRKVFNISGKPFLKPYEFHETHTHPPPM